MLFNSLLFIVFFTVVVILYWIIPGRYRWILLILASFFFYGVYIPAYTAILAGSVLMNYGFGRWIGKTESDLKRKQLLIWGIVLNIGMLGIFKYANEFITIFDFNLKQVIMPLGISFFTFTNLSYLIEVKRRKWEPEMHLGYFTVFVTFFPKLIQGPIERPQTFMSQVREPRMFDYDRAVSGLRLILWGFFKKLVIADRLALAVNPVYDNPQNYTGPAIVIATTFYSIQIYADFSGYIDIARGCGRLLGFELLKNFNIPYAAKSIKDFWTRWHITLSTWLRDYIFLPVAYSLSRSLKKERYLGIRTDKIIYSIAITITFVLCGLWHGVGWTFLAWGSLYAIYLVIGHLTERSKKRLYKRSGIIKIAWLFNSLQVVITFALVTLAWVFFRSSSLLSSVAILSQAVTGWNLPASVTGLTEIITTPAFSIWELLVCLATVPLMFIGEYASAKKGRWFGLWQKSWPVRWVCYYSLSFLILALGKLDSSTFVYFQF
jgi:alginate O-acetyltransferase complex protein AlgI